MQQLSLLEQARLERPGVPEEILVTDIAGELLADLDEEPPISLSVVAASRGIDTIEVADLPVAGSLSREDRGFVIRLRRSDRRQRRRFTGFHEVSHTFQPGYALKIQTRCPSPSPRPPRKLDVEGLCNLSAAELILPRRFFAPDVADMGLELESLIELAHRYDASLEATAFRLIRFWPEDALFVVLEPGLRKSEHGDPLAEPKLRIRSRFASGQWPFVPTNKSVAPEGVFARAQRGEEINEMTTINDLGIAGDLLIRVVARVFPYRDSANALRHRVLALCAKGTARASTTRRLAA